MAGRHAAAQPQASQSLLEQAATSRPAKLSALAVTATAVAVVPLGISASQNHAQANADTSPASELRVQRASTQVITADTTADTRPAASIVKVTAKPAHPHPKLQRQGEGNHVKLQAKITGDDAAPRTGRHAENPGINPDTIPISHSDWVRPIPGARITSEYGQRGSLAAAGGTLPFHNGVDFGASMGTPIHAANDGVVVHVGVDDFDTHTGGIVVILHRTEAGNFLTSYNHMRFEDINVDEGDTVKANQVIAKVGSEGRSTGPHLHFSTRLVSNLQDPLNAWTIVAPREFMKRMGF